MENIYKQLSAELKEIRFLISEDPSLTVQDKYDKENNLKTNISTLERFLSNSHELSFFILDSSFSYVYFNNAHRKMAKAIWNCDIFLGENILSIIENEYDAEELKKGLTDVFLGKLYKTVHSSKEKNFFYESTFHVVRNAESIENVMVISTNSPYRSLDVNAKSHQASSVKESGEFVRHHQSITENLILANLTQKVNESINGITNCAMMIREWPSNDTPLNHAADSILSKIEQISNWINSLIQFTSHDGTHMGFYNVQNIIKNSITLSELNLSDKKFNIIYNSNSNIPSVKCNRQEIELLIILLIFLMSSKINIMSNTHNIEIVSHVVRDSVSDWIRISLINKEIESKVQKIEFIDDFISHKKCQNENDLKYLRTSQYIIGRHDGRFSISTENSTYSQFNVDLPLGH